MTGRHALITLIALLFLGSTPTSALAASGVAPRDNLSVVNSPTALATMTHYFQALKPRGGSIHDYAALASLYPHVTLSVKLEHRSPSFSHRIARYEKV